VINGSVGSTEIGDMDRDEALRLLKGGPERVAEWNRRREAGEEIPRLAEANLIKAGLRDANLCEANLLRANLREAILIEAILLRADLMQANLSRANLSSADLSGADLGAADLAGADLSGANLSVTSLHGADLSGADLSGANLSGAILSSTLLNGANLSGVTCCYTTFANVDLRGTTGLESIKHDGPSTIGIDTLLNSEGKISEAFLRGCGVPESAILNRFPLIGAMDPVQFYSCFISYSSKDRDFAERLHADLQAKGIRTWFDQEHLKIGDKIRPGINEAIRVHDKLMLVLTEHSITSDWVEGEVEAALERERREKRIVLFPIRLDDSVMETPIAWASHIRQTRHIGDFRGWENHSAYQSAFARLLKDLRAEESTGAKPT
jgi:uncharacterized protein YjbI with pentapeptide repeats